MAGRQSMAEELRFAQLVSESRWGGLITPQMLVEMSTINAARNIGLDGELGSIEVGKKADLVVITGDPARPYQSLIESTPANVRLVLVNGVVLYGDVNLQPPAPIAPGCELADMCGCAKFMCVATPGGTPAQLLGQTYAEIESNLVGALATYDANGWPGVNPQPAVPLSPMSPIYRCRE